MNELDKQHRITADDYGMGNFIDDLKERGYLTEDNKTGEIRITPRTEEVIRRSALAEIFGKLRTSGRGQHTTKFSEQGEERNAERREYHFGARPEQIDMTTSLPNAHTTHDLGDFRLI